MKTRTTSALLAGFISGVILTGASAYLLFSRNKKSSLQGPSDTKSFEEVNTKQADARFEEFLQKRKEINIENAPIRKPCLLTPSYYDANDISEYFCGIEVNDISDDEDVKKHLARGRKKLKLEKSKKFQNALENNSSDKFHMATPLDFEYHKIHFMD